MDRNQLLGDTEEAIRTALDGRQSVIWTALPCIVQSVNFAQMTVSAQPTIQGKVTNQQGVVSNVNLPLLINVPIVFPTAGGFALTLPIAAGDEVLVLFASRCIDAWWQQGGINVAMEDRMHDLSDGFAIPGPRSVPNVLPNISQTGAQIRNTAGDVYVEVSADGKIKMKASEVDIEGNLNVSGIITGGAATVPVVLNTHVHSGVTPGPGTSGPPV